MRLFSQIALSNEQTPFWKELWLYIYENHIAPPVYYEHLNMETADVVNLELLVLGLFVGLMIASFGIVYDKRVLGELVRKLLATDCLSPEKAQTLEELGFARNSIIRHSVRKGINLRRVVRCREEEAFLASLEEKRAAHEAKRREDPALGKFRETAYPFDLEHDHFYIPEDLKYTADFKFSKKGNSWFAAIMFMVLLVILYVVFLTFLPSMLEILNDFLGGFTQQGSVDYI